MRQKLKIDFVSNIACPWCVIGLGGLERALGNLAGEIDAEVGFHPFELNPDMPAGGENGLEHIARKYGMSPDQVRENRARIRDRAADVGFTMSAADSSRAYNTFMRIA
jgi:predicted DsbA family dithiol-disulfide isomerase